MVHFHDILIVIVQIIRNVNAPPIHLALLPNSLYWEMIKNIYLMFSQTNLLCKDNVYVCQFYIEIIPPHPHHHPHPQGQECRKRFHGITSPWLNDCNGFATQLARFMGPTWGPSRADRTQVGPMLAPWTLLSGYKKKQNGIKLHIIRNQSRQTPVPPFF